MDIAKAEKIIASSQYFLKEFWEVVHADVSTVTLSNAGEWSEEAIEEVKRLFGTDDVDDLGGGCDTCGYGSHLEIYLPEVEDD